MKHIYTFILFLMLSSVTRSQNYQFGLVHNGGYSFSVTAVPNFNANNVDISDVGFALMLPAGDINIINLTTFSGRPWSGTEVTAAQLSGLGLGDGSRDAFAMNLPPGQTILSHADGSSITLLSFELTNMPDSGLLEILSNTDPIAIGLGGVVDSFFNVNIDNSSIQNYFGGLISGQQSFSLETLSSPEIENGSNTILVYPNPAKDYISIKSSKQITGIDLYDVLGKKVLSFSMKSTIPINNLPNGMYILKISTEDIHVTKTIIKH